MTTHYHLLVRTSEANISRAVQWLNGSYGTRKVRGRIVVSAQSRYRRALRCRRSFVEIVRMVERMKGETWEGSGTAKCEK